MQAAIDLQSCAHCGARFRPSSHRPDFCCAGCQFVHGLIAENGLGQFYELQDEGVLPVASVVFQKRDFGWLQELAEGPEAAATGALELDVQGLSCLGCAWLIEKLFTRRPGALSLRVDPALGQLALRWQPRVFDLLGFARELQSFGYLVGPRGEGPPLSRGLHLRLGICAALALNTMLFTLPRYLGMAEDFQFAGLFQRFAFILGTFSFVIGGSYFFLRSWHSLREGVLHIDLPISLGLAAAYVGSVIAWTHRVDGFVYFDFVATFTCLMLFGRWLQQKAIERNVRRLLSSGMAAPAVRDSEKGEKLEASEIHRGTNFLVDPGQIVPVRARLESPAAALSLEWINGESEATSARRGRVVSAGSINCGPAPIALEALETWPESLLTKLLQTTSGRSLRNLGLERFIRGYILVVIAIAVLGFVAWLLLGGALLPALQVLVSVLVVSCPCASGVALPFADDLAAVRLQRHGVFVRTAELWAKLHRVRKVVFDKTGTLSAEGIALRNTHSLKVLGPAERAVLLALVHESLHPVSGCLREHLLAEGVRHTPMPAVTETVGFGLELTHGGATWRLGRPEWMAGAPQSSADCIFSRDGQVLAAFQFGEEPRADAAEEATALQARGCEVHILSGDRRAKVAAMAEHLQIPGERCHAEMSPRDKAEWIRAHDHQDLLYIGDGANDSLAFDAAWCAGTPAVDRGLLEQKADFYFLGRGLHGVRALLEAADQRRRTARSVVGFAIIYNIAAISLSLAGQMSPLWAAILMPASSVVSLGLVFARMSPRSRRRTGRPKPLQVVPAETWCAA